jgi:hypothetical protein
MKRKGRGFFRYPISPNQAAGELFFLQHICSIEYRHAESMSLLLATSKGNKARAATHATMTETGKAEAEKSFLLVESA